MAFEEFCVEVFDEVVLVGRCFVFYCYAWRLSEIRYFHVGHQR